MSMLPKKKTTVDIRESELMLVQAQAYENLANLLEKIPAGEELTQGQIVERIRTTANAMRDMAALDIMETPHGL